MVYGSWLKFQTYQMECKQTKRWLRVGLTNLTKVLQPETGQIFLRFR